MNSEIQRRKIKRFLNGKGRREIDVFCIYQWIDRCYYQGWWDSAVALGSVLPPNSLSQDYQKRVEFLLGQCRNQENQKKEKLIDNGISLTIRTFRSPQNWNFFGHRKGSQAEKIDEMLFEGMTIEDAAHNLNTTPARIRSHIYHLERTKNIPIVREGGIYKISPSFDLKEYQAIKNNDGGDPDSLNLSVLTNIKTFQLTFWNQFKKYIENDFSILKLRKPQPQHWYDIGFGTPNCHICLTINSKKNILGCELYINDSKQLFYKLLNKKEPIETELDNRLEWHELPDKKACRIKLLNHVNILDIDQWNSYFEWLKINAEMFQKVFPNYVNAI